MPPTELEQGQVASFYGCLQAVTTVALSNVVLSGLQNIEGATGVDGDRVLLTAQTTESEDGIWIMQSGAWNRSPDADIGDDLGAVFIGITGGNYAGQLWQCANPVDAGIVGTDTLAFDPWQKGDPDGLFEQTIMVWNSNGPLGDEERVDGIRLPIGSGKVVGIVMAMGERGRNGDTIVDIKKHSVSQPFDPGDTQFDIAGTSIYTTPANRPTIAGSTLNPNQTAIHRALAPDTDTFALGDYFTMDIVQETSSSRNLTVLIAVRYS